MMCALLQVVHVSLDGPAPVHVWQQLMGYKWNKEKIWISEGTMGWTLGEFVQGYRFG